MKYLAATVALASVAAPSAAFTVYAPTKGTATTGTRLASALSMRMRGGPYTGPSNFFSAGFNDGYGTPFFFGSPMPLIKNCKRDSDMILRRSSPCYEITEDEKQYQLFVDVPGVKASDLNIQIEEDGRILRLSGERKAQEGKGPSKNRFEKAWALDRSIDTGKITANLADGVVVVTAPKITEPKNVQQIPITENIANEDDEQVEVKKENDDQTGYENEKKETANSEGE